MLKAWRHWDSMYHKHVLLTEKGGKDFFRRQPYQTATQTSLGFSQMAVILQLLLHDFWLSQVEDLTSQNLHNCENLRAPLLSVIITSLLTVEGKERYTEWLSNEFLPMNSWGCYAISNERDVGRMNTKRDRMIPIPICNVSPCRVGGILSYFLLLSMTS